MEINRFEIPKETHVAMQNRFMFALYTVKSTPTNLVPLPIQSPSFSSWIIANDSFFKEWRS